MPDAFESVVLTWVALIVAYVSAVSTHETDWVG